MKELGISFTCDQEKVLYLPLKGRHLSLNGMYTILFELWELFIIRNIIQRLPSKQFYALYILKKKVI